MTLKFDIQQGQGDTFYKLTHVGVKGVKKPILVNRNGINKILGNILNCSIDMFVDLPANQKGSHMSRNVEILDEVVLESTKKPIDHIENIAVDICRRLLIRHEYAQNAEVKISTDYFRESRTPLGRDTYEMYEITCGSKYTLGNPIIKSICVKVLGMTACPCGQQTVTEMIEYDGDLPVMTHNQRNICTLNVLLPEDYEINIDELIDIIQNSFSSPTYELLKRPDEGQVIINAHNNTKFVEDVVRNVLDSFVKKYINLPDSVYINVTSESEESIHKHNAFAQRESTLGDLRKETCNDFGI